MDRPVTEKLAELILDQVQQHGTVVWYDPDGTYEGALEAIETALKRRWSKAQFCSYAAGCSFLALRHGLEAAMSGRQPPRAVIHLPMCSADADHALIEYTCWAAIMRPGQQPPECNTALEHVARLALCGTLSDSRLEEVLKQVREGKLTVDDLDQLLHRMSDAVPDALANALGAGSVPEAVLCFLCNPSADAKLVQLNLMGDLSRLLASEYGYSPQATTPRAVRTELARYLMVSEAAVALGSKFPSSLASVARADSEVMLRRCAELVRTWRSRSDLVESYRACAAVVEKALAVATWSLDLDSLAQISTFLVLEQALLDRIESALADAEGIPVLQTIDARLDGFWAQQNPDLRAEWALLRACAQLLLEADRVEGSLAGKPKHIEALYEAYALGESPWCRLDTYQRRLENLYYNYEAAHQRQSLVCVVALARQRYMEVAGALAERFTRALERASFRVRGATLQRQIYRQRVAPHVQSIKTAYIWVDALRYEMARELSESLADEYELDLSPAVAVAPTITQTGMAALLPLTDSVRPVLERAKSDLLVKVDGRSASTRQERVELLTAQAGCSTAVVQLGDLLPQPGSVVRERVIKSQLVLVTSQEIDQLCEQGNELLARRLLADVLHDLRRAFGVLVGLGVERLVLTADHGHLFGERLHSGMKIDPPGGDTVKLGRRAWVGRGGAAHSAYLRTGLSSFGFDTGLEYATPYGLGAFKAPGPDNYYHGGLSPQELIIPVVVARPLGKTQPFGGEIDWVLMPGSAKITSQVFSVTILGQATGLFPPIAPRVRVEMRSSGEVVGTAVYGSYGHDAGTNDLQLKTSVDEPNRIEADQVMLLVEREVNEGKASVHLLDANSGVELARLDGIEIDILD
ncbi:MAG: PglZ domain-containing protein [Anaerolineales bacterium]|nr:PglZ domain-containing protein [Anaerolineales bacterium]